MQKKNICLTKQEDKKGWSWPLSLSWTIAIFVLLGSSLLAFFLDTDTKLLPKPTQDIYVVDRAKIVSESDRQNILALGHDMNQRFGAQLVVVTMDTLDGSDIREYSNKLFRSWGIGSKEKNNGVLMLIAKNDRKFRIEVGYGLEGRITDGYAGSVLDGMKPDFKKGNYSPAIMQAYLKLSSKIYEEYGATLPQKYQAMLAAPAPNGQAEQKTAAAGDADDDWDIYTVIGVILIIGGSLLVLLIMRHILFGIIGAIFHLLGSGDSSSSSSGSSSDSTSWDSDSSDSFGGGSSGGGGSDDSW